MYPILFQVGSVTIYSYGFFFFLGFVVGGLWLAYEAKRRKWSREETIVISIAALIGGMIGARLSILFFNGFETAPIVLNFFTLFDPRIGPGSILGGIAGGYIGGYVGAKSMGKNRCACDAFAPTLALAMAVGRIGDFLGAGASMGKPTNVPWGVPLPGLNYLVHPAPLYDAAFNLLWFGALVSQRDHPRMQNGNLFKLGIAGYAVFRFVVEFVRTNRIIALGLTGQQLFCLALLTGVGVYYYIKSRSVKPSPVRA
jgi:phosphatidylglycerol:prolipoprotein diacylglycerol transferase